MWRSLVVLAALAASSFAIARPVPRTDLPQAIARPPAMAGTYRSRIPELPAVVHLRRDGTCQFTIRIEDEDLREEVAASGRWGLADDGTFACANDPGPARLELVAPPSRDPRIALEIDARTPDGRPARGLGLNTDSQTLMIDDDGRVVIRTQGEMPEGRIVSLIREADGQPLWEARVAPGGPNSFLFTYHPSREEPESLRFIPVEGKPGVIAVELGQGGFEFQKVSNR